MTTVRPETLGEFVGQVQARRILEILISAAKKRNEPVPHLLMSGSPGLGKTSLARIVAHETGGRLIEMIGSSLKNASDLTKHLMELKHNDVLFCDELHSVPRRLEEILYPALEDRVVTTHEKGFDDLMKQIGVNARDKSVTRHALPPFTFIGATTLLGLVSPPFRSRFGQILELQPYSVEELRTIVTRTSKTLGFALPDEISHEIATRSRGTARTAVGNLMWFRDFVQADGDVPTMELLQQAFELKGIDNSGLTRTDRDYLARLAADEEPVGLDTLASALGESVETLEASVEPFLLRQGYVRKTARGRVATAKARALFQEETV